MNYIDKYLNDFNYDVNGKLKEEAEQNALDAEKEIERLNNLIRESTTTIALWQNAKSTADKQGKAYYNALIQKEKETLILNKDLLKQEKEKKKFYESTAKAYVEASELILNANKENTESFSVSMEKSDLLYKLWLTNNEDLAGNAEKLARENDALNEKLMFQKSIIEGNIIAYSKMVELYGENYEGSRNLYNALLEESYAYNKIADTISDNENKKIISGRESIFALKDYLEKYKEPLMESGFSEEEVYDIARRVSGYSYDGTIPYANLPVKISIDENNLAETAQQITSALNSDSDATSSYKITGEGFAKSLGDGFISEFKNVSESMVQIAKTTAKDALNAMESVINNTTNTYNFTTSPQTIFQQIEDTVRAEELKKARGL